MIVIKTIPQILPPCLLVWMLTQFFQDFTAFLSHSLLATVSLLDQNQLARLLSCPETQRIWFIILNVMGCPQCLLHTINCFVVYGVIWDNQVLSPLNIWLKSPGLPLSIWRIINALSSRCLVRFSHHFWNPTQIHLVILVKFSYKSP